MSLLRTIKAKRRTAPGAMPGTVAPRADAIKPRFEIFAYGDDDIVEMADVGLAELAALRGEHKVLWVNVTGLGDADLIIGVGEAFGLHRLALEDVVNTHQRPKVEEFDDHLFLVTIEPRQRDGDFEAEQVALFLGPDYLLTFQEHPGDCFDPIRERVRSGKGRIRAAGPDYLCYALIDAALDGFYPVLDHYGDALEALEIEVIEGASQGQVPRINSLKRDLLFMRRAVWPQREMINTLIRDEYALLAEQTRLHLRDCYDHAVQLMDIIETYREIASGLVDIHISSVSARLNEIMKVLTVIATIFMPLSFIASLYGMNFDRAASPWNMPELGWRFGYPFSLALMAGSVGLMLWYFRRKNWLGGRPERRRADRAQSIRRERDRRDN